VLTAFGTQEAAYQSVTRSESEASTFNRSSYAPPAADFKDILASVVSS